MLKFDCIYTISEWDYDKAHTLLQEVDEQDKTRDSGYGVQDKKYDDPEVGIYLMIWLRKLQKNKLYMELCGNLQLTSACTWRGLPQLQTVGVRGGWIKFRHPKN